MFVRPQLNEKLHKLGASTDVSKLGPKVTHVVLSKEYMSDKSNAIWIADIEEKAPNAELVEEDDLKTAF